jgi:hypothetical protein
MELEMSYDFKIHCNQFKSELIKNILLIKKIPKILKY